MRGEVVVSTWEVIMFALLLPAGLVLVAGGVVLGLHRLSCRRRTRMPSADDAPPQ
jgi:hypothetical protein